ncbi:hypothetical protein [Enterococcus mundtii]
MSEKGRFQFKVERGSFIDILVRYFLPVLAILISTLGFIMGRYDSKISNEVGKQTLKVEENYNHQSEQLLLNSINYSLATNELLIEKLLNSSNPVKTYEQYYVEYLTTETNYAFVETIDLSRLYDVNRVNTLGYMYFYQQYLATMEVALTRLRDRSDVLKEMLENGEDITIDGDEDTLREMKNSEYKVDWILVENESTVQQSFVQMLLDSREMLTQLKEGVINKTEAEGADIERIYQEALQRNNSIINQDRTIEK